MADLSVIAFSLLLVLLAKYVVSLRHNRRVLRLPPGPKPLPIIGNILDVHGEQPWATYRDWSQKYRSDVLFLEIPRRPTIILNSFKAAYDLLERRSRNYSDRPRIIMNELTGWDFNFGFMEYGQRWRDLRRIFHQHFYQGAANRYHSIQTREVRACLKRMVSPSESINMLSVSQTFTSVIFDVVYGLRVYNPEDRYVSLSQEAMIGIIKGTVPGAFWIESFPWLKYLPSWCPGSSARRFANRYRHLVAASRNEPFAAAKQARIYNPEAGSSSMVSSALHAIETQHAGTPLYSAHEDLLRDAAGVAYIAAVDTQKASMHTCFVALAMHPAVQRKAQQELDAVVGIGRLPTMDDISALPYVQAIYKEVSRWMPVVPTGLLHRSIDEDVYNDYTIPSGSVIIYNAWAMLHDPEDYPDPYSFNPDRFMRDGVLNTEVRDPETIAFGFGRRICPGRYLASDTLQLLIASILHVYDILPTTDLSQMKLRATVGLVSHPDSLPCRLKPRNEAAVALIQEFDYNSVVET